MNCLMIACKQGYLEIVKYILESSQLSLNDKKALFPVKDIEVNKS